MRREGEKQSGSHWVRTIRLVAFAATLLAAHALAAPASATVPHSMAALGDSLTTAWASGAPDDYRAGSWATGSHAPVDSHYLRLLRRTAVISGNALNFAVGGSKMAATYTQADKAIEQGAEYVTIFSGTNDVCVPTFTSPATYAAKLRDTLTKLTRALPEARILVISIPDWYRHWEHYRDDPSAREAWARFRPCPVLFDANNPDSGREATRQRIADMNAGSVSVCAAFPACTFDGGAVFRLLFRPAELSPDYFHFSVAGQARVAAATWAIGPYARPAPLERFAVVGETASASLSWTLPEGVARVLVVQKEGTAPAGPADGAVVYDGSGATGGARIEYLTPGVTYHYAAWTFDVDGERSDHVASYAVPSAPPTASATPSPPPPLAAAPPAPPTPPTPLLQQLDSVVPVVHALATVAPQGTLTRVRFRSFDESGGTRTRVRIYRRGRLVYETTTKASSTARLQWIRWRPPSRFAGTLYFCVRAWDRAGNASAPSCARLILRRRDRR